MNSKFDLRQMIYIWACFGNQYIFVPAQLKGPPVPSHRAWMNKTNAYSVNGHLHSRFTIKISLNTFTSFIQL